MLMRHLRHAIFDLEECCDSASAALAGLADSNVDVVVGQKWDAACEAIEAEMKILQDCEKEGEVRDISLFSVCVGYSLNCCSCIHPFYPPRLAVWTRSTLGRPKALRSVNAPKRS